MNVSNFKNFLKGHSDKVLEMLENRMKQFSDEMEFERAINEREKLAVLKRMLETQIIEYSKEIDEDVFVFEEKRENVFLCVLNIREGKVINKNHIIISMERSQEESLFERLITSYYEKRNINFYFSCVSKCIWKRKLE